MTTPRRFVGPRSGGLFLKHILRKVFLEDWPLKVVALIITFALWYGVSLSSKKGTATMAAQLAFRVSDESVLMSAGVQDVTIRVAGDDQAIDRLFGNDIRVAADLTQTPNGDSILVLTPQSISTNLPSGVRVEDIQPSRFPVKLEAVQEKYVPVQAALVGEPASGYEVYSTTVNPARVRVRGPESFMSTLESVPTGPIDIGGAKSDLTARQVPISISNQKAAVFNTVADVTIQIGERRVERSFELTSGGKRVRAVIFGPRSMIAKIKPVDLKADIVRGESGETAQLVLPESLRGIIEVREVRIR